MKILKFTTTIPEKYRDIAYTEVVVLMSEQWDFSKAIGILISEKRIHAIVRNIKDFNVESLYFVEDETFEETKQHFKKHLSIFDNTEMPFTIIDNVEMSKKEIYKLFKETDDCDDIQFFNLPAIKHFLTN